MLNRVCGYCRDRWLFLKRHLNIESNPFARKAGAETGKSPFNRNAEMNKSLHKGDSFFNKVEAAEADKSKRKYKPILSRHVPPLKTSRGSIRQGQGQGEERVWSTNHTLRPSATREEGDV